METVKCARCGKKVEPSKAVKKKIIYQDRKQMWDSWKKRYVSKAFVANKVMDFCSEQCAVCEQMAMEG